MATVSEDTTLLETVQRSLAAAGPLMSEPVARYLLALRLSEQDRLRMDVLAEKSRNGELSTSEAEEIDGLRKAAQFLDIFQLKARLELNRPAAD